MTPSVDPATVRPDDATAARGYRTVALALLTAALIAVCVLVVLPFLPALTWGVAFAVIAWPVNAWLVRRFQRRGLAAALTTALIIALLVVPATLITYRFAAEAGSAVDRVQGDESVHEKLAVAPGMAGFVAWLDRVGVNLDQEARRVIASLTRDLTSLAQGSVVAVLQFAVAIFILFFLLRDRESFLGRVRGLMPLTRTESDYVMQRAADSIHANLYANFLTSVIDGVGGGLVLWAAGVPSPMTWGVAMFVLSFVPVFGTWVVWGPATLYLAMSEQWAGALGVFAWGMVSAFVIGGVIYTRLAGDRLRLHQVPVMLAFLGGLAVFGAAGIVLGPGILAVTAAILEVWHQRAAAVPDTRTEVAAGYGGVGPVSNGASRGGLAPAIGEPDVRMRPT